MRFWLPLMTFVAVGCSGDDTTTKETGTETDEDPGPTDSAGPGNPDLTGLEGSIVLTELKDSALGDGSFIGVAITADDDGGLLNMAGCLVLGGLCIDAYPAAGASATPDPDLSFAYSLTLRDPGDIEAARTFLVYDRGAGFNLGTPLNILPPGNLVIGGDLLPFSSKDAFEVVGDLTVSAPDPMDIVTAGPGATVDFAWKGDGAGDMYLEVGETIYGLKDNGAFTLNVDDLGLEAPVDVVVAQLSRVVTSEVDASGNNYTVQTRRDQFIRINYISPKGFVELRDGVTMADDCAGAETLTAVGAGEYYGDLSAYDNDLGYDASGAGFPPEGNDGVIKIELTKGQELSVTYDHPLTDPATYLMEDKCDESNVVDGSDDPYDSSVTEAFEYTAPKDGTYYLVLDTWTPYDPEGDLFELSLTIK